MQIKSWEHRNVLITGSSGFVGRRLVSFLVKMGANVLGISRHTHTPHTKKRVDVSNKTAVLAVFESFRPDVCFHLASEALVESGAAAPYETFENNVKGALNILEASRIYGTKRTIIASTSHVYGKAPLPYHENDPAKPSRPYETSKTCVDLIAQSYADSFGLPVLIPRFVNIYGPGDGNMTRVIPKTMKSVVLGVNPVMWGGNAKRQYLYIDDAISVYDLLARISDEKLQKNRIYNVGFGQPISVREVIQKIISLSKVPLRVEKIDDEREEELMASEVSSDKLTYTFHWKPKFDFDKGLRLTYDWYKKEVNKNHLIRKDIQ